jgi:Ca2+-transporting ATPase
VRSVTFATLVLSNLGLILVNRSWRLPVWRTVIERRNPTLKWILGVTLLLLTLMLTVPSLRNAFNFGPVTVLQAAAAVAASVAGVAWFEVYKLVAIRRR